VILAIPKFDDFDTFVNTFSTKGLEKRKEHGSRGSRVFRDPEDSNRALVVFDMDMEAYEALLSDPDMPAIFQEAGLQGAPQKAELAGEYEA
jgi:hypothetical protein